MRALCRGGRRVSESLRPRSPSGETAIKRHFALRSMPATPQTADQGLADWSVASPLATRTVTLYLPRRRCKRATTAKSHSLFEAADKSQLNNPLVLNNRRGLSADRSVLMRWHSNQQARKLSGDARRLSTPLHQCCWPMAGVRGHCIVAASLGQGQPSSHPFASGAGLLAGQQGPVALLAAGSVAQGVAAAGQSLV